ncbi:MAG: M20/M25/M40 family metallo-hydrolase [Candidatus Bathyarchaeia archaeon]
MAPLSPPNQAETVEKLSKSEEECAVKLLEGAVRIYSPSGSESKIACFLAENMRQLGLEVEVDEGGNVLGTLGGGRPRVLLCGHMDTVPGILPVRVSQGRVLGRGAVDAKSALAAMIMTASAFAGRISRGELTVACLVDEEGQSRGVKHLVLRKLRADYAVFGEPSGVENLTVGYKGSLHVTTRCRTTSGHASSPWAYENAIERSYELWQRIRQELVTQEPVEDRFHSVSACLTGLRGGEAINVVPGEASATIDIRIPPGMKTSEVAARLEAVLRMFQSDCPNVKAELSVDEASEGYEVAENSRLVQVFADAVRAVRGKELKLLRKTGTGDMNIYASSLNVPSVTYGPGNSRLSHGPAESIQIAEYLDSIRVLREAVKRLLVST